MNWGLKQKHIHHRNGWFYYLWKDTYCEGRGFRPTDGDRLVVWTQDGEQWNGTICEVKAFHYTDKEQVSMAVGGIADEDKPYVDDKPNDGRFIGVRCLNLKKQENPRRNPLFVRRPFRKLNDSWFAAHK